jgi:gas vesicle protein
MLFPLKFVAANIFMAGVTAGAIGGAAAVYVLSDQQRREKLKDCADKMRDNCKTMWNTKPTVPTAD